MSSQIQLHGGFILKTIIDRLEKVKSDVSIKELLHSLSTFSVDCDFEIGKIKPVNDPIFTVLDNLLSRGLPTISSIFIEESITKAFKIAEKETHKRTGEISFKASKKINSNQIDSIIDSFYIVDPRLKDFKATNRSYDSWEEHMGSEFEEIFYNTSLPKYFDPSICQIIESQRSIDSILKLPFGMEKKIGNDLGALKSDFYKQRVDFSIEFPNAQKHKDGLVIEIDGSQHLENRQKTLDEKRDKIIDGTKRFTTARIKTNEVKSIGPEVVEQINDYLKHPYFEKIKSNYNNPIWGSNDGLEALQLALTPFAIARVQKTILHLLNHGIIDISAKKWVFGFIERDVPCAKLAIDDLKQLVSTIFDLEGKDRTLPEIEYHIFSTKDFKSSELNSNNATDLYPLPKKSLNVDVLFDISTLQRSGLSEIDNRFTNKVKAKKTITIRSSYSQKTPRLIKSDKPIKYKISKDKQPKELVYFLQNVFRKEKFREGQVDILKRTLNHKNVIALLPTGAGKSLTYQLSGLLQPGIVIIVDPLKSLMKDQDDNLKASGIDSSVFINSSIKTPIERRDKSEKMMRGYYQFVFISPERFQIKEFRDYLKSMVDNKITYCVVDEAHCVSEWGHDFRTAYLKLGENAKKYCNTLIKQKNEDGKIEKSVPLIGLTGTASFDVLADVKRELGIFDDSAIVRPSKYERKELNFEPINVGDPEIPAGADDMEIKKMVAGQKQLRLHEYLNTLPKKDWGTKQNYPSLKEFQSTTKTYTNSGLVFCPHVGWAFGVKNISANIRKKFDHLENSMGIYAGSLNDSDDADYDLDEIQNQFKRDELSLLVATKAFGMGIDKPNIRYTIHFNMPQSIESFYQEAGRAGRDRQTSYCAILYCPTKSNETEETVDKGLMTSFHRAAFKGSTKEKRILWELLDRVTYPEKKSIDDLNQTIKDNAPFLLDGLAFLNKIDNPRLKIWRGDFPARARGGDVHKRIYLNGFDYPQSLGYIDLLTEECKPHPDEKSRIFTVEKSTSILQNIYKWLKNKQPDNLTFMKWILLRKKKENADGIEKVLSQSRSGKISIGFRNKIFQNIADMLMEKDLVWTEGMIDGAYQFASDVKEFVKGLNSQYRKRTKKKLKINEGTLKYINDNFKRLRNQQDTFKAIYRLSIIGVIDEYEVDYRAKTIIANFSNKKKEQYLLNMKTYISRYVSSEEVKRVESEILKLSGKTVLQKCCGYLTKFVYEEIATKRLNAITSMEEAIIRGVENRENFEADINYYFDSKYYSALSEQFRNVDLSVVWSFMEETEGGKNGLQNLNGACTRLLDDSPNSPILLLLRAFSRILIEDFDQSLAIKDLRNGWSRLVELKSWSREEQTNNFEEFYNKTIEYNSSLSEVLDYEILRDHLNWIKNFNDRFLKGVANA